MPGAASRGADTLNARYSGGRGVHASTAQSKRSGKGLSLWRQTAFSARRKRSAKSSYCVARSLSSISSRSAIDTPVVAHRLQVIKPAKLRAACVALIGTAYADVIN